ncbi:MAG: hypothetical protein J6A23_02135 [Thermoguttaceae bacterium]|nr:hypothetical protein [Thermoguttaceae bacterium]
MNETLNELQNRMKKELRQNAQAAEGLEKWALAGRLALLGEPDLWENCEPNQEEVAAYFKENVEKWDDLSGQKLADAIIRVQDLILLKSEDPALFAEILDHAEGTILDADAEAILEEYLVFWPIPEEKRLNVVDAPISDLTLALLKTLRPEKRKVEAHWNEMKRSWETPGTQIQWTLRNREKFMFSALPSEGIRSMRIGVLPVCRKEESDMWETLPHSNPTVFEKFGLTVDLYDGRYFTVPILEHIPTRKFYERQRFAASLKSVLPAVMAAETDAEVDYPGMIWQTEEWEILRIAIDGEFRFIPEDEILEKVVKLRIFGHELTDKDPDGYWKVSLREFHSWLESSIEETVTLDVFLQGEKEPISLDGEDDTEE